MATSENDDTWGDKTNANLQLLENAIAKRLLLTLSSSDVTLTDTNFADSQARSLCLGLTGTLTGNVNIIVPSRSKMYLVQNGTSGAFTVTVKTAAGTGVVCPQGATIIVYCDATNVVAVRAEASDAQTLDGLNGDEYARLAFFNQFTSGNAWSFRTVTDGAVVTVDGDAGNNFIVTLGGNRVIVLDNPHDGQWLEFWLVQDATGNRTVTWPANVQFEGGTPTLSTTPNSIDRIEATYNLTNDLWMARFSQSSTSSVINERIAGNEVGVRMFERLGSPGGVVTVNILVPQGVILTAPDTETPALDLSGFASGSTMNLVNLGFILGHGGDAGDGGGAVAGSGDAQSEQPQPGFAAGDAILGPGAGITFNITNGLGFIWGGGGGGGGGGLTYDSGGSGVVNGGGGGGGAGSGKAGRGSRQRDSTVADNAADGGHGGSGPNGTFGTGGAGAETAFDGGNGGNGGDWGAAGASGTSPTSSVIDIAGGAGGAAGKAIELNGGAAPTFISGSGSPNVEGAVS